ncbi:hypothetical protein ACH4UM_40570 [Streptomyces sp. NPDC020801]|uniref:hypothetical protein n=1 Tax=unclassified Streptomyces TaxID=2593676 RepID=UPI0037929215
MSAVNRALRRLLLLVGSRTRVHFRALVRHFAGFDAADGLADEVAGALTELLAGVAVLSFAAVWPQAVTVMPAVSTAMP